MSTHTSGPAPQPWVGEVLAALRRARRRAEEVARQTRTLLVVAQDGKPVAVAPPAENAPDDRDRR